MMRKMSGCLTALFMALGFLPNAQALGFYWSQTVAQTIIPGEHIVQHCYMYPVTSYQSAIDLFSDAYVDCEYWHMEWPYYDHWLESHEYQLNVPGQDLFLGNIVQTYYSCPGIVAVSGYAKVRWRGGAWEDQWYSAADWFECWGGGPP